MESEINYRLASAMKFKEMVKELPEYSLGQILHSVKYHLKKDKDTTLFEASDAEIYRAMTITIENEK